MDSEISKLIRKTTKSFALMASTAVFCGALYYTFFMSAGGAETEATVEPTDVYGEYRDFISNSQNGVRNLLDGAQLKAMELKEYGPSENQPGRNPMIFSKPF